jgi:hypothetical protein
MAKGNGDLTCREAGKRGGRPTKLTPELQDKICALIEETACSFWTAGLSLGIVPMNLYNWDMAARAGKQPYRAFLEAVMQARAKAELKLLAEHRADCAQGKFGTAGRGQSWLLSVRFPEDYDNRFKYDKQLADLSPQELDEYIATCDAQFGSQGAVIEGEPPALVESNGGR